MPGRGRVADPGLSGVLGSGAIMNPPVSVCHQVFMIDGVSGSRETGEVHPHACPVTEHHRTG